MPKFLNPIGRSSYGIGLCDRCKKKFFLDQLTSDPNFPGLRVCHKDLDDRDPWRMAPRQVENVSLLYPRPETPLED